MPPRKNKPKYKLSTTEQFDARHGYTRCSIPGVQIHIVGERRRPRANWWDPEGNLVVRFTCQEEVIHLEAARITGKNIQESDLDDFSDFVAEILYEWLEVDLDGLPYSVCNYLTEE